MQQLEKVKLLRSRACICQYIHTDWFSKTLQRNGRKAGGSYRSVVFEKRGLQQAVDSKDQGPSTQKFIMIL